MLLKKKGFFVFTITTCLLLIISTVLLPQNAKAALLTVDEAAVIASEYLELNEKDGTVTIEREQELKSRIGEKYFNELVQTMEKLNQVIVSPEGEKYKENIIDEVNSTMIMSRISGCGAASLAGFAHTAGFAGLMTIAGVSGPVGWALGTAVGGVWLGASAAAGCLN